MDAADQHKRSREHHILVQVSDVVEVIQGTIETVDLPEKADIILSEWMGYEQ